MRCSDVISCREWEEINEKMRLAEELAISIVIILKTRGEERLVPKKIFTFKSNPEHRSRLGVAKTRRITSSGNYVWMKFEFQFKKWDLHTRYPENKKSPSDGLCKHNVYKIKVDMSTRSHLIEILETCASRISFGILSSHIRNVFNLTWRNISHSRAFLYIRRHRVQSVWVSRHILVHF